MALSPRSSHLCDITAFLIISLVTVITHGSRVTAQDDKKIGTEAQNRVISLIRNPNYVAATTTTNQLPTKYEIPAQNFEQKPASKPNIPNKVTMQNYYVDIMRPHTGQIKPPLPPRIYPKQPLKLQYSPNAIYQFPRVIPLQPYHRPLYMKKASQPITYTASTDIPIIIKSPKLSLLQVINRNQTSLAKPPPPLFYNTTTSTTTTTTAMTTTTQKILRTKRIWPKRVLDRMNSTINNTTLTKNNTTKNNTDETDKSTSESRHRVRYVYRNSTSGTTTEPPSTTRVYRPVTRKVKVKSTTPISPFNFTKIEPNDWIPILPTHYTKVTKRPPAPKISKRSDISPVSTARSDKQAMYLQSFGLVPMTNSKLSESATDRKTMIVFKRKRKLKPYYSGYSGPQRHAAMHNPYVHEDLESEGSHHHRSHPHVVTKIKHHHHHHHHRYVKTVEKPVKVPYKVEVPKPYPINVEKQVPVPVEKIKIVEKPVPYPVTVEKQIPYPIKIKIPQPVPVKVVEKEYVPKPYPVFQRVPVLKHVQVKVPQPVPVPVEKQVPYPVEVKVPVPVDRPVPVPVHIEKRVPYPVPVKVLVPQPYPVETKVPYPVEVKVKEPIEVIKHVPIKVPYPQPYAVKVPHPVAVRVEKRVPYPVEVEKKVPVPFEVYVPQKVEVEKKVPVYVPKPYPVVKKVPVPYPVRVPYPVKVPVKVPVEVPVFVHHPVQFQLNNDEHYSSPSGADMGFFSSSTPHTVTIHGNVDYNGFQSRSDNSETTTANTLST